MSKVRQHVPNVPRPEVAVAAECGETGITEARTAERRRVTLEVLLCGDRRQTIQPAIDGCERPIQKCENQARLAPRSRSSATRSGMLWFAFEVAALPRLGL
jgi:hypothetical protein